MCVATKGTHLMSTAKKRFVELGELIAALRLKAGLGQQLELAKLLKTTQQTVSRWENGDSRPRIPQLLQLAKILEADPDELLSAAGYTSSSIVPATFAQPFPINTLSWENFERFCRYFLKSLYPEAKIHAVGSQGHKQDGTDISAVLPNNTRYIFQCKRVQDFGPADVEAVVKNCPVNAEKKIILLSRAASPKARAAVEARPGWDIWDKEDVTGLIRENLSKDAQCRLVDTFFQGQRLALLGIAEPGPWQNEEEFFALFQDKQAAFSHGWELVGRSNAVETMLNNLSNQKIRLNLLIGPGGGGKTRLLKQAIALYRKGHQNDIVRVLAPNAEITIKELKDLGKAKKLLVVDDAQDQSNLDQLFQFAAVPENNTTLLLASRPYGIDFVKTQASPFILLDSQVAELRIEKLTLAESTQLAIQVLEEFHGSLQQAESIASMTVDCPLATVIGARVVARKKFPSNKQKIKTNFVSSYLQDLNKLSLEKSETKMNQIWSGAC